jgi:hypothetical protein
MVHSHFITSDNVSKKGITFLMILVQKVVTDVQMLMQVLLREFFGTNLAET